jgi:3-hexulose-6-phosphate synthase
MKLQAALDFFNLEEALNLMKIIHPYVDIAEIGTPLMLSEGFRAVSEMKRLYPNIDVLADIKLMDGGRPIAGAAFDAGADIVTVLGVTNNFTISGAVSAAQERSCKRVCVDTIGVVDLAKRTKELESLGADFIAVHTAHDLLGCVSTPIEALKVIKENLSTQNCKSVISGGITPEAMPEIVTVSPDVVIVGSGLTKAKDPLKVALTLKSFMS